MICLFFFNDTATTEIYTLSLHDALPISGQPHGEAPVVVVPSVTALGRRCAAELAAPDHQRVLQQAAPLQVGQQGRHRPDRKSTRLNSSHANISYAVFCLKKKKKTT